MVAQKINVNRSAVERAIDLGVLGCIAIANHAECIDILTHIAVSEVLCEVLSKELKTPVFCGAVERIAGSNSLSTVANPLPPLGNILRRAPALNCSGDVE